MIWIENTTVLGFDTAIRGMRNPLGSWAKSDSGYDEILGEYVIGDADKSLMKKLVAAGTDHSKFMRMITVTCDITAPQYFVAELDTYKIGTVRNSCSLQHTGAKKPFTIDDFSAPAIVKEILAPEKKSREYPLVYPECVEDDYREYVAGDRKYRVYRNGMVISCAYERKHKADSRTRNFAERTIIPTQTHCGYYQLNIGGKEYHEKWMLHRLVAEVWMQDTYFEGAEINHKDGNKGNNSVDNLEWVTHSENERHKHQTGLSGRTIHTDYIAWKNATKANRSCRRDIAVDKALGMTQTEIAKKYGISQSQVSAILRKCGSKNTYSFELAEAWEEIINCLNELRDLYMETGDYDYFIAMRAMMPMGYNYRFTWQANYTVLRNVYHARKHHKLREWHAFCRWIETLPQADLITGGNCDET